MQTTHPTFMNCLESNIMTIASLYSFRNIKWWIYKRHSLFHTISTNMTLYGIVEELLWLNTTMQLYNYVISWVLYLFNMWEICMYFFMSLVMYYGIYINISFFLFYVVMDTFILCHARNSDRVTWLSQMCFNGNGTYLGYSSNSITISSMT